MSKEKYSFRCYKYAPQDFKGYLNGVIIPLTSEQKSLCGNYACCGKPDKAIAELKRIIRAARREAQKVTIGFFKVNDGKQYMFTRQLVAYDDDLAEKLRIYKEFKSFCLSRNCDLATHTVKSGDFNPFGKSEGKVTESHDLVDVKRPVKIRLE